ncbi:MAG: AAA family ATPase, partial [Acholeplasma sp.]|nr:AAA family ATPase [Acholeplasma sp.]
MMQKSSKKDDMQSIIIKNYKNFEQLELDSLSKVNLIVGNNNVGKSTLLEAILLLTTEGSMASIYDVLEMRGELYNPSFSDLQIEKQIESFTSLISQRSLELFMLEGITMSSKNNKTQKLLNLKIVGYIETQEGGIDQSIRRNIIEYADFSNYQTSAEYGLLVNVSLNDEKKEFLVPFNRRFRAVYQTQKKPAIQYVKTAQITKDENALLFDRIAMTASEEEIIKALNIIEPGIDAINFLMDEYKPESRSMRERPEQQRVPFVVYKNSTKRVRLSSMGDGMNRILTIILALLNAKDGFLLIDEFGSGLHYSVQTKLWEIVFSLSKKHNVQVFATTHSNDCIKSFVQADNDNQGKLIRLEEIEGTVMPVPFNDKDRLKFAVDQNIEIR